MSHVIGIYHKDCIDGTASAAAVVKAHPEARMFPLPHSYKPEDLEAIAQEAGPDSRVFTVDCTFGAREFLMRGIPVTTIDHHADRKEELERLMGEFPHFTLVFDETHSGAALSWNHFHHMLPTPRLIELIEDVDLWLWKYGKESRDTSSYLWIFRNDPQGMLALIEGPLEPVLEKGSLLSHYADTEIEHQCNIEPIRIRIGEHTVQAHNITTHQSASGNKLAEKAGATVGMFTVHGPRVKISFRSKEGQQPNALTLAAALGGGGHPNAAGATVSLPQFMSMIVQS